MTVVAIAITEGEVRRSILAAQTHLERAAEEIVWQIENRAWEQIGYSSWDAMREAEYGGAAVIVPRADRPQLVARLRSEGLSQQSIGDTLGVTDRTVANDLNRNISDEDQQPPTIVNARGQERPTTYTPRPPANVDPNTGEILDAATVSEPRNPPRRSLVDSARDAGQELRKAIERLERIAADDRFARNKNEVAAHLRHHLAHAIKVCQDLDNQIN
jgi:hypothetical protein